jgi:hypothetical protein
LDDRGDDGDTEEAKARKERSVARITAEGVPTLDWLPVIESESECRGHTKSEVVHRTIALAIVAAKADTDYAIGQALIDEFNAEGFFTPKERAFMDDADPSEQDVANFIWRYEAAHVMLWALGIIPELRRPDRNCDVEFIAKTLRKLGTDGVMRRAALRPQAELLEAADLIYRYHWATRQAELTGKKPPAGLAGDVVLERHHALNWLIGYAEEGESPVEWDEISTDT